MSRFDDILERLRAAGEATRLRTLCLLAHGELTVSELTQLLDQSQPRVSRHLKVLTEAGLIERYQEGAWVFYRFPDEEALTKLGLTRAQCMEMMPAGDHAALTSLREERAMAASQYFAAQADNWESMRTLYIDDAQIEAALIDMAGEPGDQFLDLGTGTGRMLIVFKDLYRYGIGYDISSEMLTVARARLGEAGLTNAQVRRCDFLEDELPHEADLICLHHVLHFLAEPERALAVAGQVLSKRGKILIADFAPHDHEDLRESHAHRRLGFDDQEIADWAKRLGLSVTATRSFNPPVEGGLIAKIWRLEDAARSRRPSLSMSKDVHDHVIS